MQEGGGGGVSPVLSPGSPRSVTSARSPVLIEEEVPIVAMGYSAAEEREVRTRLRMHLSTRLHLLRSRASRPRVLFAGPFPHDTPNWSGMCRKPNIIIPLSLIIFSVVVCWCVH